MIAPTHPLICAGIIKGHFFPIFFIFVFLFYPTFFSQFASDTSVFVYFGFIFMVVFSCTKIYATSLCFSFYTRFYSMYLDFTCFTVYFRIINKFNYTLC